MCCSIESNFSGGGAGAVFEAISKYGKAKLVEGIKLGTRQQKGRFRCVFTSKSELGSECRLFGHPTITVPSY